MKHSAFIIAIAALGCTSGCATVLEGRTQDIAVDTMPEGATCILKANDELVGVIEKTPGHVLVDKSKYDIVTECNKDGYIRTKTKNHSDMALASFGNYAMLTYSFIGTGIDSATGAANKYDSHMMLTLDVDKDYQAKQQFAQAVPVQTAPLILAKLEQPAPAQMMTNKAEPVKSAGKYSTVENLATKKPEALPPALPSEMAVPYIEVASTSLEKPVLAPTPHVDTKIQIAQPNAKPAIVAATTTTPPSALPAPNAPQNTINVASTVVATAAPIAHTMPEFVKSVPKATGTVTHMPNAATMQMAQLSDEQCAMINHMPVGNVSW